MLKPNLSQMVAGFAFVTVLSSTGFAAKTYQVTGPITEVSDTSLTVEKKAGDSWTIARTPATKLSGGTELKKGDKVTVYYSMSADEIEVKGAPAAKAVKKK